MNSQTIKKPWITEKSGNANIAGKYTFMVESHATKPEVRKALKEIYKVDAVQVNMVNRPPKQKKYRGGKGGLTGGYRKAIVTLKKGQKIDLS